jgi:hypothetical protein
MVKGRLSTQKYPTSSKAFVAELIPDPLKPVIMTRFEDDSASKLFCSIN